MGSFPADVCRDITGQFGCSHREKFRPSVSGGGGVGGGGGFWVFGRTMGVAKGRNSPLQWAGAGEEVSDK